jgi:hypothetical protein
MPRLAALRPAVLALALLASAGACTPTGGSPGAAATAEPLTPLPAPAGLLADLYVPQPAATWSKARAALGGPALFLPQSFGALVTTLAGLPITMAAEIDEAVPMVGAALRRGKEPAQVVIAVHVKAGDRFVDQLTRGESARMKATLDGPSRVTLLVDKLTPESGRVALGVIGNYLLVSPRPADLLAVGPYAARTLPTRGMPKEEVVLDLPEAALAGPVVDYVRELRGRSEGAAAALVPASAMLDGLMGLLGDARAARVTLGLDGAMMHARATVTPKPGDGAGARLVAQLAVGDARPLLELPEGTTLGLLWRESAAARAESAPKQAEALGRVLARDLKPEDGEAIKSALRAEAEARGDWQAIGVAFNGTGPTAVVRAPVNDADRMKKAIKQLVDLAALPSIKRALTDLSLRLTVEKAVVENLAGDVTRVRVARVAGAVDDGQASPATKGKAQKGKDDRAREEKAKAAPDPQADVPQAIDLLYLVNAEGLFAAAGFDPKDSLRGLLRAPAGGNLGGVAPMAAALAGLGDASFVLIADALRINAMTTGGVAPPTPVPLVLAAGRNVAPAELWARADVPVAILQQLATEYMRRASAPSPSPQPAPTAPAP